MVARRTLQVTGLLIAVIALAAWYFAWQLIAPPTVICSLADPSPCDDFEGGFVDWVAFSGRPTSFELVPAPKTWTESPDRGFQAAEWAVRVDRFAQEPVLAACYYSSDDMITCHGEERAFEPRG